jgi:hypothetical protein
MKLFMLLILSVFASEKNQNDGENDPKYNENPIFVKIEENENAKKNKKSKFIGILFYVINSKWRARRRSKNEKKLLHNGYYDDEETAARASDTLARKLLHKGFSTQAIKKSKIQIYWTITGLIQD